MSVHQVMADYAFDMRPLSMVSCQMHNLPLLDVIGVKPPTDERAEMCLFVCLHLSRVIGTNVAQSNIIIAL